MNEEKEISFDLPTQIEIAEALHSIPPGPNRDTVSRMAIALDLFRSGEWKSTTRTGAPGRRREDIDGPRSLHN